jgi:Cu(I)/Ag(I) efflux system membrane fusion protein
MTPAAKGWLGAGVGLVLGAAAVAVIPAERFFVPVEDASADAPSGDRYACPMMDFIGHKPGLCPVCGMTMERVVAGDLAREQQRRMGLRTVRAATGPAMVSVRAYGAAEYDERFSQVVIPRVGGRIVKRHEATFGCCQEVLPGDPIVDLYSPEAYQAQAELAAAVKAGDPTLVAAIEARFARWNLSAVAARIRAGGEPVDTVTITSPVGGQAYLDDQDMVNQTLMVGGEVKPDMPLLKLVDGTRLTLVFHVPEPRVHALRTGQRVRLASDDLGDLPDIEAVVGRVSNEINPEIRSREVTIHLTGANGRILPGSLLNARIEVPLGPDLKAADPGAPATWGTFVLVPKSAVLSTGVRHVAWRVKARKPDGSTSFEPVPLALGPRIEDAAGRDLFVVRAGLNPGDEVAEQGAFLIDSQAQLAGTPSLLFPDGAVAGAGVGHGH